MSVLYCMECLVQLTKQEYDASTSFIPQMFVLLEVYRL